MTKFRMKKKKKQRGRNDIGSLIVACPTGKPLVPSNYKSGNTSLRRYCRNLNNREEWKRTERRTKTTYGFKPWPIIERSTEVVERPSEEQVGSHEDGRK
jgi:hypothetical protein